MTDTAPDPERPNKPRPDAAAARDAARKAPADSILPDTADAIGVAKVAGGALWRAITSITKGSVDAASEIAREVQAGEPVSEIIDHQVAQARSAAVHALGLDSATTPSVPRLDAPRRDGPRRDGKAASSGTDLRSHGNAMLKSSWKAANQPVDEHPSFAQILNALTPDEARILRFLAVAGPQPAIDVRTKTPFGVGSERLAGGINMIADMAGCTAPDHDQHYLANLNRLGLVRFSQEPVEDFRRYSFVEAQPKAQEAMAKVKKAKTIYRSIYLSLFGIQFCEVCFDLEGYDAGGWVQDDRGDKIIGKGRRVHTPKEGH